MPCYDDRDRQELEERRRREMPCNMHNDSSPEDWKRGGDLSIKHNADGLRKELEQVEAMLCMIMQCLLASKIVLPLYEEDFKEAGITQKFFDTWWQQHERKDRQRREGEQRRRELAERKKAVLMKLTAEERELLGLPPS
jgi:hypothetical protein